MAISKVVYKSSPSATPVTWMDATSATAAASDITSPKTAMLANGVVTQGTGSGGGGTTEAEEKDVNFIDYDGKILYSYTAAEAQALSALPSNPTHTGLTSQGWNWTLAQIKSQLTNVGGKVWVGQMYVTNDGKTRVYLHIPNNKRLNPYLALCPDGTVTVDWGDNSSTETLTGTSLTTAQFAQHTYPSVGDYVMTLTATNGSFAFYGATNNAISFLRSDTGTLSSNPSQIFLSWIKKIEIGTGAVIGDRAFRYCWNLEEITIPSSATSVGANAFSYCAGLKSITIPPNTTAISNSMLFYCYLLSHVSISPNVVSIDQYYQYSARGIQSVVLPLGLTTLSGYAFSCYSAAELYIPSSVTSIANNAFAACYSMKEIHVRASSPPTLGGASAFANLPSDCVIYVPYSSNHSILNSYQTASNWSTYASYMQEEPA